MSVRVPVARIAEPALCVLLVALFVVSLAAIGRYPVSLGEAIRILLTTAPFHAVGHATDAPWIVIEIVRLPRLLLVVLCGMGLALGGAAMQGVFRNPLVSPDLLGVSAGAACGGAVAIVFGFAQAGVVGLAFALGFSALALAFVIARLSGRPGTLALVLAGVIVGAFFGALLGLVEYLSSTYAQLPAIIYWLLGSFAGATYEKAGLIAAVVLVAGTALIALRWRINLLSLSDRDAVSLGVNVDLLRWCVVVLVAAIVAAQVSVSGVVAWVGLVVPHVARMIVGPEHTRLLPASALLGGIYLLAMDDIARGATSQEIPIGLLTAAVGAPMFTYLFWKFGSRGWSA
jgi:iron complex transport system permease protein